MDSTLGVSVFVGFNYIKRRLLFQCNVMSLRTGERYVSLGDTDGFFFLFCVVFRAENVKERVRIRNSAKFVDDV